MLQDRSSICRPRSATCAENGKSHKARTWLGRYFGAHSLNISCRPSEYRLKTCISEAQRVHPVSGQPPARARRWAAPLSGQPLLACLQAHGRPSIGRAAELDVHAPARYRHQQRTRDQRGHGHPKEAFPHNGTVLPRPKPMMMRLPILKFLAAACRRGPEALTAKRLVEEAVDFSDPFGRPRRRTALRSIVR